MNNGGVSIDERAKEGLPHHLVVFQEDFVKGWQEERKWWQDEQRKLQDERRDVQREMIAKMEAAWDEQRKLQAERNDEQHKMIAKIEASWAKVEASWVEKSKLQAETKEQAVRITALEVLPSFPLCFDGILSAHYSLERCD